MIETRGGEGGARGGGSGTAPNPTSWTSRSGALRRGIARGELSREAASVNGSRFLGSNWALAGRFGILLRSRLRGVPFGTLRTCVAFGLDTFVVLSKFESPPLRLPDRVLAAATRFGPGF